MIVCPYRRYRQMTWLDILSKIEDDVDKGSYVTALRGCDVPATTTKILFAGFIRGNCRAGTDINTFEVYILNRDLNEIADELIKEAKNLLFTYALDHYMLHVVNALSVIGRYFERYISKRLQNIAITLFKREWNKVYIVKQLEEIKEYISECIHGRDR